MTPPLHSPERGVRPDEPLLHASRALLLVLAIGVTLLAAVIVREGLKRRANDKEIKRLLSELRLAGQPLNPEDLAALFPNLSRLEDAERLYKAAFAIAAKRTAPSDTPFVMTDSLSPTQRIEASVLRELTAYCAAVAEMTNALPAEVAPNTRFPMNWVRIVDRVDRSRSSPGPSPPSTPFNTFVGMRQMGQSIAAQIVQAAEVGDADRAVMLIEHGFRLNRCVNPRDTLVAHMIRHALDGLMCTVTERLLNRVRLDDAQLLRISAAIPAETEDRFLDTMRIEHGVAVWVFGLAKGGVSTDILFGTTRKRPFWERWWERVRDWRPVYADTDFVLFMRTVPQWQAAAGLPPLAAAKQMDRVTSNYLARAVSEVGEGFVLNWHRAFDSHGRQQARLAVLKTALAVERHRRAHAENLPSSLADLLPTLLPRVPDDVFDAGPLKFRKVSRGYTVYSIGPDGVDNAGNPSSRQRAGAEEDVTITVEW